MRRLLYGTMLLSLALASLGQPGVTRAQGDPITIDAVECGADSWEAAGLEEPPVALYVCTLVDGTRLISSRSTTGEPGTLYVIDRMSRGIYFTPLGRDRLSGMWAMASALGEAVQLTPQPLRDPIPQCGDVLTAWVGHVIWTATGGTSGREGTIWVTPDGSFCWYSMLL